MFPVVVIVVAVVGPLSERRTRGSETGRRTQRFQTRHSDFPELLRFQHISFSTLQSYKVVYLLF